MTLTILVAAAAASFSVPKLDANTGNDILRNVRASDDATVARIEVMVDPRGRIVDCLINTSTGDEKFAARICKVVAKRRAQPARDFDGQPVYGVVETTVTMHHDPSAPAPPSYGQKDRIILSINRLPNAADGTLLREFKLNLKIDDSGQVIGCDTDGEVTPALTKAACATASGGTFAVLTDKGAPVAYVRTAGVELEASEPSSAR